MKVKRNFVSSDDVWFKESDIKKINMMESDSLSIISTVCPDYPNDGQTYTFRGKLGTGVSLTAQDHIRLVPHLIKNLKISGFKEVNWTILVSDITEIVWFKKEQSIWSFSRDEDDYMDKCGASATSIQEVVRGIAKAQTFFSFYEERCLDYLAVHEQVAQKILQEALTPPFQSKFASFALARAELACRFRGRQLSWEEIREAAAYGMASYVAHGTLLRKVFQGKNLLVVNHKTNNLQNFYLCRLVHGLEYLIDSPKFPLGIIPSRY